MVRQILLVAVLLLAAVSNARAELNLNDDSFLPANVNWKNGIGYSLIDNKINYLSTVDVLKRSGFSLAVGYAGDSERTNHKAILNISYDLVNLQKLGVETPILKYVDLSVGGYIGFGNMNLKEMGESEFDGGLTATIVSLKF